MPIAINPNEATIFKGASGIYLDIEPPAMAPNKLARTRADEEPINTAVGLFVEPLMAKVAS